MTAFIGTAGNDLLIGSDFLDIMLGWTGNNTLYGRENDDALFGHEGNDFLYGDNGNDRLYGGDGNDYLDAGSGSGSDRFILGNSTTIFYNDRDITTYGIADYALITDFSLTLDKIQLKNTASQYVLSAYSTVETGIYLDTNINGVFDTTDELMSVVKIFTGLNLNSTSFVYVY